MLFAHAKVMIRCAQRNEPEAKRLVMQASEELRQNAVPTRLGDQSVEFPIKLDEVADICTFGSIPNRIQIRLHPMDFGTSCSFRRPASRLSFIEEPHLDAAMKSSRLIGVTMTPLRGMTLTRPSIVSLLVLDTANRGHAVVACGTMRIAAGP
jgi:hypothetical protein